MPVLVAVLPSDLARARGGAERYAFELHAALREALPDWDHVSYVAASRRAGELVPDGWTALGGPGTAELPSADALRARDVVRAIPHAPDAVLCHQWRTRGTAALRVLHAARPKVRLLGFDHGGGSVAGLWLARLPLPEADVGLHHSQFSRTASTVRAQEHVVLRGGLDPARFHPPAQERRDVDVLLVGRFLAHKGQDVLIGALPEGARAMLIGPSDTDDPAYMRRVVEAAERRGVEVLLDATDEQLVAAYGRARYTAQVPVQTVARADATPPELLGLTMLEAMACGSVPICPATGASAEFVVDGRTGRNYRAEDAADLERVLEEALAGAGEAELRAGALAEAARWTWAQAAAAVVARL